MRRANLIAAVVSWFMCLAPPAAAGPAPRLDTSKAILGWINGYRARKQPERLPQVVHAMARLGLFRDLEQAGVYIGFMAGVLGSSPAVAEKLVKGMFPMPPPDQVAIVRAIAYSGLPDWKPLMRRFIERMPARRVLIQRHLDDKLPTLATLKLQGSPAALDANWGYYFASGSFEPVDRIIAALAWTREGNDLDKLTAGHMAKWTLANNALQDKDLLDHLKTAAGRGAKTIRSELRDVVEAAETFETARIRRQAAAAIEQRKAKGPQSTRNFSFWSQAGQTALALGCVVAGALGHAEVAVPCVIGGAASTAAIKVFGPQ